MSEDIEVAKELLNELLVRMGVDVSVESRREEGELFLDVKGDRKGILIGKHGHTLESLQFLTNRIVAKRLKEPAHIIVDVDDYRKRRAEYLTRTALRAREKVKTSGRSLTIGPFPAADRRMIHVALREDPLVKTESLGEGEVKKIRILLRKEEGKPAFD